jgi:hypothetical protein
MKHLSLLVVLYVISFYSKNQTYFNSIIRLSSQIDTTYILQPIDYAVIDGLFKKFQNDGWIEFKYPQNGCQYRAHAMARILLENGIKSNKIWSFRPALLGENNSDWLTISDPNFNRDLVKWAYHVAPVVVVKMPNNSIDTLAIDPSMFSQPVSYKRWLDSLHCKTQFYTFIHPKYVQYQTTAENKLDGVWYTEGYSVDMRWISTSICKGKIFYMFINNEIKPLQSRIQEINIKLAASNVVITQKQRDGLEIEKTYLSKIYNERKSIATNSDNFGKLPGEYQAMLIDCQEKLMECIYFYWDSIESNQVMLRCKY